MKVALKSIVITAVVALGAVALANRVPFIRALVYGAGAGPSGTSA